MENKDKKKKKSNLPALLMLFLVIALGAGYYLYTQVYAIPVASTVGTENAQVPIQSVDWNKELYQREDFSNLTKPLPLPLPSGQTGNESPFVEVLQPPRN